MYFKFHIKDNYKLSTSFSDKNQKTFLKVRDKGYFFISVRNRILGWEGKKKKIFSAIRKGYSTRIKDNPLNKKKFSLCHGTIVTKRKKMSFRQGSRMHDFIIYFFDIIF